MNDTQQMIEIPVQGMDCAECAMHVQQTIAALPGVTTVNVLLAAEKAVIAFDPLRVDRLAIAQAVQNAGYTVPITSDRAEAPSGIEQLTHSVLRLFGLVIGAVLFIVVIGEWLGLFDAFTAYVPWPLGLAVVLIAGYPVLRNVVRAALQRQITAHTLMTLGMIAALAVGEWATAAIVVFFMRVGDYAERFTTERARRAVKDLTALAPRMARVVRDGIEVEVPLDAVRVGETVIVRPGEQIPVDGEVISGQATIDQAAITGESMPIEATPGTHVFAATMTRLGSLRIRVTHVGADTTFGRVIRLVAEAETHRAEVQRIADRFSTWYLPVVVTIALLTLLIRQDALATAAVLVVACSCAFALATPIAMLASIGAGAKRGLLIKGGKYLEVLARADVLLIDKTGTLTIGRPQITQIVPLGTLTEAALLRLAATAERYSEHPLAEAVRQMAQQRGVEVGEPQDFVVVPGMGVRATVDGRMVVVGNQRMVLNTPPPPPATELEAQGQTLLYVACDGQPVGLLAASDIVRREVPQALAAVRELGIQHIELLTGDNECVAATLASQLGVAYRAQLLPEDKIAIVRAYQAQGHTVVMVGDGVNDAPALAQADVGMAMGVAGTDIALEAAHVALMRDDWLLVPEALHIARRTLRVVKLNIGFTAVYNLLGLSLAALGFLPPILAAAAQSLPDLVILANSSRLLRPTSAINRQVCASASRRSGVACADQPAVRDGWREEAGKS